MANRDDQPFRGLEPDHYRRSGLKDAVSHYLSPLNPLTSTAPQPFPNNLTMPLHVLAECIVDLNTILSPSSRTQRTRLTGYTAGPATSADAPDRRGQ